MVIALALLWPAAACSDDADGAGTQPAPAVSTFEQGEFDDLPRHPRSEPIGPRSEMDGVVTQSFSATGATPEQVISFFTERLQETGWTPAEPAHREDTPTRADFTLDDLRLELTATSLAGRTGPDEATVQYSLVLRH